MATYIYHYHNDSGMVGGSDGGGGRGGRGGRGSKTFTRNRCNVCFKRGHDGADCWHRQSAASLHPVVVPQLNIQTAAAKAAAAKAAAEAAMAKAKWLAEAASAAEAAAAAAVAAETDIEHIENDAGHGNE